MYFYHYLLVFLIYTSLVRNEKFISKPLCIHSNVGIKIVRCTNPNERLLILEEKYSNDINGECSRKNITDSNECIGFGDFGKKCNGFVNCRLEFGKKTFSNGSQGSNCDFQAEILTVKYECIPSNMNDKSISKYEICSNKPKGAVMVEPSQGFIHGPNFFINDNNRMSLDCKLIIKIDSDRQRLEVYLLGMELAGLSNRTNLPLDTFQINNQEILYGERYLDRFEKQNVENIYNSSSNAVLKFKTLNYDDKKRLSKKRGFYMYFKVVPTDIEIPFKNENYDNIFNYLSRKQIHYTSYSRLFPFKSGGYKTKSCPDEVANVTCDNPEDKLVIHKLKFSNDIEGQCTQKKVTNIKECFSYHILDKNWNCPSYPSCYFDFGYNEFYNESWISNCDHDFEILTISYDCDSERTIKENLTSLMNTTIKTSTSGLNIREQRKVSTTAPNNNWLTVLFCCLFVALIVWFICSSYLKVRENEKENSDSELNQLVYNNTYKYFTTSHFNNSRS